jgi:hypothetical protein
MATDRTVLDTVWGKFENLSEMQKATLQNGRFVVEVDKGRFECLFFNKDSPKRLFVLLSGARDPKKQVLPKFDRWSWYEKLPGAVLCISDPTLFLDTERLRIGWYLGDEMHDWSRALADLVSVFAQMLNLSTRRIITYGSSAGGFASLKLAAMLGDATAVAINPQINALKYYEKAVTLLLEIGYGGVNYVDLSPELCRKFSAIDAVKIAPEVRCLVVQNKLDTHHYAHHFKSFCDVLGVSQCGGANHDGRIITRVYESPDGHGPEPKSMVDEIIGSALKLSDMPLVGS